MSLIVCVLLSFCQLIYPLYITQRDHTTGITNHYKHVGENYQLLGELRDYCDTSQDCREYAYFCNRNSCECADGYRADERNKTCIGGVGAKCQYDSHCIENAFCRHQLVCFCKKDFWIMPDDHWRCKAEWESGGTKLTSKQFFIQLLIVKILLLRSN